MRPRTLKISATISGFRMPIATIKIKKFADIIEPDTALVCPHCGQTPKWNGGYDCTCCPKCGMPLEHHEIVNPSHPDKKIVQWKCAKDGWQEPTHLGHWSQLKRVLKATGEEIIKPKLLEIGRAHV